MIIQGNDGIMKTKIDDGTKIIKGGDRTMKTKGGDSRVNSQEYLGVRLSGSG